MEWRKEPKPWRAELIKDVNLTNEEGKIVASASKDNLGTGIVTHYGSKQIGRNIVRMCIFHPDVAPDDSWVFSRSYLNKVENR